MLLTVPNSWGTALREGNDCHLPAGSPASSGGEFCSTKGGALPSVTNVRIVGPRERLPKDPRFHQGEVGDGMWMVITDQGWMELSASKHYIGPHLSVQNVAVNPDLRGQGYGQALYLAAVKAAKTIGRTSWPRYRGVFSSPGIRTEAASRAWAGLKRRFPKRVKRVRGGAAGLEVLE